MTDADTVGVLAISASDGGAGSKGDNGGGGGKESAWRVTVSNEAKAFAAIASGSEARF
jgi:hypothetical protein